MSERRYIDCNFGFYILSCLKGVCKAGDPTNNGLVYQATLDSDITEWWCFCSDNWLELEYRVKYLSTIYIEQLVKNSSSLLSDMRVVCVSVCVSMCVVVCIQGLDIQRRRVQILDQVQRTKKTHRENDNLAKTISHHFRLCLQRTKKTINWLRQSAIISGYACNARRKR